MILGQERTGDIEGVVKDQAGAIVPGVEIKITGVNTGFNRTVTTDSEGSFRVLQIEPGSYTATTNATGFNPATSEQIIVTLGKITSVNFNLQVTGVGKNVVDVTVDAVAIDPTNNAITTSITEREIELTPKANLNFSGLLRISPAVRPEVLGAGFQIDGSSGAENTFTVDGLEVTNFRTGQLRQIQNIPDAFGREVQVKTSGFNAEFGGATGGVINVVTRGGDNQFRGEFGTEFETSKLNAISRADNINGNQNQGNSLQFGDDSVLSFIRPGTGNTVLNPPSDQYNNFFPIGRFSGPIIKNRLWFFASGAPQYFTTTRNSPFTASTFVNIPAGGVFNREGRVEQRNDYYLGRLDAQVFSKLRLTGTYTYNPQTVHGELVAFGNGTDPGDFSQRGGRVNASNYTYQGVYSALSNLIFNVRGGRNYLNEKDGSYGVPSGVRYRCFGSAAVLATFQNFGCQIGTDTGSNFNTIKDISIRNNFNVDSTLVASKLLGRHIFKFGYQRNDLSNDVEQGYFNQGLIIFRFGSSSRGFGTASTGNVQLTRFGTVGFASSTNEGLFAQDNWQIARRLTLNLGVRIERENVPSFSANGQPINFGFGSKIAPRLGFAYDVFGKGKSKIFASYGQFYDRFKYELPRGSFGGDQFLRTYNAITPGSRITDFTLQSVFNNPTGLTLNFRVPSNDPTDNRIDPNLKPARQSEYTIGYEQELFKDLVLRTRYTHKKLDTTIEDVGFFDAVGNENFFIANPGQGIVGSAFAPGIPATPKAERKYDVFEVNLDKRFAQQYFVNATYSYSRLFGNYSGLASSDEKGRSSPNVNRFFDIPFLGFDVNGNPDNGRLATDRPHVLKVFAGYTLDYKGRFLHGNSTDFSLAFIGQSGTPLSTRISLFNAQTFLNGRGDLGRTDRFTQTDIGVTHRYRFGRDNRFGLQFMVDVINLFNQNIVTDVFNTITPTDVNGVATLNNFRDASGNQIMVRNSAGTVVPASASVSLFSNCTNGDCTDETNVIRAIFNGGIQSQLQRLLGSGIPFTRTFTNSAGQQVTGTATATLPLDARFNQPLSFQDGRRVRFGFRFNF
ncbi:MAG: TonB-dependent receptor domain-containing protein [Pyrinomonadaceae bacterium]